MRKLLPALVAAAALGLPSASHAQAIWNPSYPQTWGTGAYQPTGLEAPFSHRYGYYSGPALYIGMNGRDAYYLEYLDRVDRAERFGRPIPPPPAALTGVPVERRRIFKRRSEPVLVSTPEVIELAPTPTIKKN